MTSVLGIIGSFSWIHWVVVLVVALLLFGGGGKIPRLMKDMGKGINSFKKGLKDESNEEDTKAIEETDGEAAEKPADK